MLIEVEVNGNSEYAPCKDDVVANMDSIVQWGDHLFFELRGLVSACSFNEMLVGPRRCEGDIYNREGPE